MEKKRIIKLGKVGNLLIYYNLSSGSVYVYELKDGKVVWIGSSKKKKVERNGRTVRTLN